MRVFTVAFSFLSFAGVLLVASLRSATPAAPVARPTVPFDPDAITFKLTFGLKDPGNQSWDGSVKVTGGEALGLELWRPALDDSVLSSTEWKISTRPLPAFGGGKAKAKAKAARARDTVEIDEQTLQALEGDAGAGAKQQGKGKGKANQGGATGAVGDNGVFLVLKGDEQTSVEVSTPHGNFSFKLADVPWATRLTQLDGNATVERVPTTGTVAGGNREDDYPSAATAKDGTIWVGYQSYTDSTENANTGGPIDEAPTDFNRFKQQGGDQVWLTSYRDAKWAAPIAVTEGNLDVYKTATAVDGQGRVWVIWSQNVNGNWDLYARSFSDGKPNRILRLTTDPRSDLNPVATADSKGNVWVAWQGFRGDSSNVFVGRIYEDRMVASPRMGGPPTASNWDPAIVADTKGNVHVAFDTYRTGNYDVWLGMNVNSPSGPAFFPIAASLKFEARAALACDSNDRVWVAWEERGEKWGKDFGALYKEGVPLYGQGSEVKVRCFVNSETHDVPEVTANFAQGIRAYNSFPRLATDGQGRLWLLFRHRSQEGFRQNVGTVWWEYATTLNGDRWSDAVLIPNSDGLLSHLAATAVAPSGQLVAFIGGDGRQHRNPMPINNDVTVAVLPTLGVPSTPALTPTKVKIAKAEPSTESEDVKQIRAHRVNGLQILRGEFHRHTEISADGRGDGSLLDMFRYGLDVAAFDWIGNGDHDNGNGREYTWWITQKLSDAFKVGDKFIPMFTYERSVGYPDGHRNAMFAQRGIRTLPRLQGGTGMMADGRDTKMFYAYLKQFNGFCASHTSATNMGTDWRDNDPLVEPVVEIYQGDRHSYEVFGAPKTATEETQIGGYQPAGFIWNALGKGYRLGFQASSDHISTHLSYACVWADKPTRESLIAGFKQRHCYAATDNIIMDVRCGMQMMGDEFEVVGAPKLDIVIRGTGPIAKLDIVKDSAYAYSAEPNQKEVKLSWQDNNARTGATSYYYVRALQQDGQMAWASPMWIRLR